MKPVRVATSDGPQAGVPIDRIEHRLEGDAGNSPEAGQFIGARDDLEHPALGRLVNRVVDA